MTNRPDRGRNCGTCDYWQPVDQTSSAPVQNGSCHIRSPQWASFPDRTNCDWCGEYVPAADLVTPADWKKEP
jgi:hypothetical protein